MPHLALALLGLLHSTKMHGQRFRAVLLTLALGTNFLAGCGATTGNSLVDVGGYRLFLHCVGQGTPTVVMDSGLAADSSAWLTILPDLRRMTRVCVYDRAALGASDHGPQPTTSRQIVQQLQTLLTRANIPGPYVLVGWSFGSWNVLVYAAQHPRDVTGVVLIDGPHPDQEARYLALAPPAGSDEPEYVKELRRSWSTGKSPATANPEGVRWRESAAEVQAIQSLGTIPLVIITAGHADWLPANWPPDRLAKFDQARHDLQHDFMRLSPMAKQIVAAESGHCVQCYQPGIVVDAIAGIITTARRR